MVSVRQTFYTFLFCVTGLNAVSIPNYLGSKTKVELEKIEQGLNQAQNLEEIRDLKEKFSALRHDAGLRFSCPDMVEEFEQLIATVTRKFSYKLPSINCAAYGEKISALALASGHAMRVRAQKMNQALPKAESIIAASYCAVHGVSQGAKKVYSVLPRAKTVGAVAGASVLGAAYCTQETGKFLYENSEEIADCTCSMIYGAGIAAKWFAYGLSCPFVWLYTYRTPLIKSIGSIGTGIKSVGQFTASEIYALLYGRKIGAFDTVQIKPENIESEKEIPLVIATPSAPPMDDVLEEKTENVSDAHDEIRVPSEPYPHLCVVCEKNTQGAVYMNQLECRNCREHFDVHLACCLEELPAMCSECKRVHSPSPSAPPMQEQVLYPDLYEKKNC